MNLLLTTSTALFLYVLILGSVIAYLVLKFDRKNRRKVSRLLIQTNSVQPLFIEQAAEDNIQTLTVASTTHKADFKFVEKQLDELVQEYDHGRITLPEYCNRLNCLLSMTA
jgi:hypothetical protein